MESGIIPDTKAGKIILDSVSLKFTKPCDFAVIVNKQHVNKNRILIMLLYSKIENPLVQIHYLKEFLPNEL